MCSCTAGTTWTYFFSAWSCQCFGHDHTLTHHTWVCQSAKPCAHQSNTRFCYPTNARLHYLCHLHCVLFGRLVMEGAIFTLSKLVCSKIKTYTGRILLNRRRGTERTKDVRVCRQTLERDPQYGTLSIITVCCNFDSDTTVEQSTVHRIATERLTLSVGTDCGVWMLSNPAARGRL